MNIKTYKDTPQVFFSQDVFCLVYHKVYKSPLFAALIHLLFIDNMDCIIEATRVFGNLTRCRDIRNVLRERKGSFVWQDIIFRC